MPLLNIGTGISNFRDRRTEHCYYVDKTAFIEEFLRETPADTTLITRPRRFGKTLTMSMLNYFFSGQYANRGDLFQNLNIWNYKEYRDIQGTYPVILIYFASVDREDYQGAISAIISQIEQLYRIHRNILSSEILDEEEKQIFRNKMYQLDKEGSITSINQLCQIFYRAYNKISIVLLDEYDTPMAKAWSNGCWEEMSKFLRPFFNATFKTNPYLERGIMTGITRVAQKSLFSGLNNLNVCTVTSPEYADAFGFTEQEVFAAMDEQGKTEEDKKKLKQYYDGFTFADRSDIYNPWSIINYLAKGRLDPYWANTATNEMITKIIREGSEELRLDIISLLNGEQITSELNEYINFSDLDEVKTALSLLVSAGYLRVDSVEED